MECKKDQNLQRCNCSYEPCSRKGVCCECLQYHLKAHNVSLLVNPKYRRSRGAIYTCEKFDKELGMQRTFVLDSGDMQALLSKTALAMGIDNMRACYYQFTDVMQRQFKHDCFEVRDIGEIFQELCDGIEIVKA